MNDDDLFEPTTTDDLRERTAARMGEIAIRIKQAEALVRELPMMKLELDGLKKALAALGGIPKPKKARAKRGAPERFVDMIEKSAIGKSQDTFNQAVDVALQGATFEGGPVPSRSAVLKVIRLREREGKVLATLPAD